MGVQALIPTEDEYGDARRAVVEWYATPKKERQPTTVNALCRNLSIGRRTYYHWVEQEWFQKAVRFYAFTQMAEHRADVIQSIIDEAKNGSYQHAKLFHELLGDHVQQVDVTSGGDRLTAEGARTLTAAELAKVLAEEQAESEDEKKEIQQRFEKALSGT